MQKQTVVLLLVALVAIAAGALLVPKMFDESPAPVMHWDTEDEVEGAEEQQADPGATETAAFERTEAELSPTVAPVSNEPRVDAILRGRVVDKFNAPVANAKVWLEIGRSRQQNGGQPGRGGRDRGGRGGGRSRRIPEPVITNAEGLFAFQGETFRNLRVTLQVKSNQHAVGLFEKDVGDIQAGQAAAAEIEVALGDLALKSGGLVRGRVTDLDGNAVIGAEVTMEPDFRNRLRWQRNRTELLPPTKTDANGFYAYANVPEGQFAVTVLAKMHTPGRSDGFEVTEDAEVQVPDIALGPGYEVTGYVKDAQGEPIAKANVRLRASLSANAQPAEGRGGDRGGRGRGRGRGGFGGFGGRDHRTETDEQGRFFLEHLPSSLMEIQVDARGFLDYEADEIDPKVVRPIYVTLQPGLYIAGIVQTPDGLPLTKYSVRTRRLRGLPDPNQPQVDFNELMAKFRDPNLTDEGRRELMRTMRDVRDQFTSQFRGRGGDRGGRGGDRGGRGGDRGGRNDRQEQHDGGRFREDGLQEGVYEVTIEADNYARFTSAEIQVRRDAAPPELTITVDPGVYVGGVVLDAYGDPIANAEVTLRSATLDDNTPPTIPGGGRGGRGGRGGFDVNRMARDWMRGMNSSPLRLTARTDQDGLFIVKNVQRGVYSLSATADNFATANVEPFQLDRERSDFEMRLDPLGVIVGKVTGFRPEEAGEVQVIALLVPEDGNIMGSLMRGGMRGRGGRGGGRGGSTFRNVNIEADGSYRIEGLSAGDYFVRSATGGMRDMMRMFGATAMDGTMAADVTVRPGTESRWDMQMTRPQYGVVAGTVMHNGESAAGFRVELRRQDNNPGNGGGQQPGGMFGRMMNFGRSQSDTVEKDGTFEVKDVTAGLYRLRVTAGRRGGVLYEEQVQVVADVTLQRNLSLTTGSVKGSITTDDGTDPKAIGGRISLVQGLIEIPEDLNRYLRENTSFDARIRDGAFEIESIPPGTYMLIFQARNRERTTQTVVVSGTENITVPAGKATPQNGGAPK
jgi:protocatechuate 3,4-dioxygenase beta subunit